jgi:hypothetical protein
LGLVSFVIFASLEEDITDPKIQLAMWVCLFFCQTFSRLVCVYLYVNNIVQAFICPWNLE